VPEVWALQSPLVALGMAAALGLKAMRPQDEMLRLTKASLTLDKNQERRVMRFAEVLKLMIAQRFRNFVAQRSTTPIALSFGNDYLRRSDLPANMVSCRQSARGGKRRTG
jgi:hypothetical protein